MDSGPLSLFPDLSPKAASPVMAQYFEAKAAQPDALIFFRMGDFYELFFDDAVKAATAIGIALTHRGTHQDKPIPMAGVPVHAAEAYLAKLIRGGFKVAVCEQMETPAAAKARGGKTVLRREVVRVVTPGTLTEDGLLDARGANRLVAVALRGDLAAVASVEVSTGEVDCLLTDLDNLAASLTALRPSEILCPERLFAEPRARVAVQGAGGLVQPMANALAEPSAATTRLKRLYGVETLDGFGDLSGVEIAALGLLAAHLEITQGGRAPALRPPRRGGDTQAMTIDPATRASLEIDRSSAGTRDGSLLGAIDRTIGAPGARLLAARLARPLLDPAAIDARLDAVDWLLARRAPRRDLRGLLRRAGDVARAVTRLTLGRGGPRDLCCLRDSLSAALAVVALMRDAQAPLDPWPPEIASAIAALTLSEDVDVFRQSLTVGLADDPPALARDGGLVAPGCSAEIDEARGLRDESRKVIAALEARLAVQSGVALKIRYNAVLGYFVEAASKHIEALLSPANAGLFIHRQTLANQARFTTLELAELDARISRAGARVLELELAMFEGWRTTAHSLAPAIFDAAEAFAVMDVAAAGAEWAEEIGACRPVLDDSTLFLATGARHAVVEAAVKRAGGAYTPNDCCLDGEGGQGKRLSIVTGPNMAGKSTFLRQNALLAVLAQAGCFVPAASLHLGVVDRLFSRVGAGDDLARGRSTFMTEMIETAAILTQATPRSLVVLDEIGRGTATWDGLAIAWACAEALHETNRCRSLFATHYHELAALETRLDHVGNLSLRAKEWNGDLVFLHEAVAGPADKSYGVQVAKLAGVPAAVVARARQVLERLETDGAANSGLAEMPLFTEPTPRQPSALEAGLAALDIDGMSPREAMETLYRFKRLANAERI
jgi:DNA mismatch repair protein MutS